MLQAMLLEVLRSLHRLRIKCPQRAELVHERWERVPNLRVIIASRTTPKQRFGVRIVVARGPEERTLLSCWPHLQRNDNPRRPPKHDFSHLWPRAAHT